jgi:hypothetical protein
MTLNKFTLLTLLTVASVAATSTGFAQSSAVSLPKKAATPTATTEAAVIEPAPEATTTSQSPSRTGVSGTSTVQIKQPEATETKALSIALGLELAEKIVKEESSPKENTLSLLIAPAYKINDTFTAAGKIVINQDNYAQHETTASDATLALSIKGFKINEQFKSVHKVTTLIPVAETTVKRDRLQSSLALSNGISYSGVYFDMAYGLSVSRNFHQFTQNAEGSANIQYRVAQTIDLKVPLFIEKFYATATGTYRYGRTYGGFERYGFIFDADLNYDFKDNLSANVGTSNDGSALKSNGVDSNIALYDENNSVVSAGVSYQY